jgi:SRSO17 transposase
MAREARSRVAWVLDDTGFPKKGIHSVGVARQYSGTLGKVGNCQIGVSLNYATDEGCFPIDFQLYLPQAWVEDETRCQRARIPEDVTFKRKWELGLEMIDRALEWGLPVGVVVADAGYGVTTELRGELRKRGLQYVVGIPGEVGVWQQKVEPEAPAYQGRGRPRTRPRNLPAPQSVVEVAQGLPGGQTGLPEERFTVTWREGTKGPLTSRFAAVCAQPSHGHAHGRVTEPIEWLLIEWPEDAPSPTKFWLSNLPEYTELRELVYWAKIRWWVEENQQLKEEIGLDHFEGRSWVGWHHHVTLVMVAFDFLVLEGFRNKKNFWVDPPTRQARTSTGSHRSPWVLSPVQAEDCSWRYVTE